MLLQFLAVYSLRSDSSWRSSFSVKQTLKSIVVVVVVIVVVVATAVIVVVIVVVVVVIVVIGLSEHYQSELKCLSLFC